MTAAGTMRWLASPSPITGVYSWSSPTDTRARSTFLISGGSLVCLRILRILIISLARTWMRSRARWRGRTEPVKLNETSGGWVCLWRLLGRDGRAGLVDPDLGGQPGCLRALALEADRAGGVGLVEDVLAAG